jgi:hypothetical protein
MALRWVLTDTPLSADPSSIEQQQGSTGTQGRQEEMRDGGAVFRRHLQAFLLSPA